MTGTSTPAATHGALLVASVHGDDPRWAAPRLPGELAAADLVVSANPEATSRLALTLGVTIAGDLARPADLEISSVAASLSAGRRVLVVVDSADSQDPTRVLVASALSLGVAVRSAPGPSPLVAALAVSGLPTDRFVVEGTLPSDPVRRLERLGDLRSECATIVFHVESGDREGALADIAASFGPRDLHVVPDNPASPTEGSAGSGGRGDPHGSGTLVVGGAPAPPPGAEDPVSVQEAVDAVLARLAAGERLKDACREVAVRTGVPSRDLYAAALAARPGH